MEAAKVEKCFFAGVEDGSTFKIGNTEYIKFPDADGKTPVVARNILFRSQMGMNNDFSNSDILKKLQEEYLPDIIAAVGLENVCMFKTDMRTLDGLKPYEDLESMVSLPTLDFYRDNVEIFDKYPVDRWWWLATPESAKPHDDPYWSVCVSPSGFIYDDYYSGGGGVRPFYILKSSIFESCKE